MLGTANDNDIQLHVMGNAAIITIKERTNGDEFINDL